MEVLEIFSFLLKPRKCDYTVGSCFFSIFHFFHLGIFSLGYSSRTPPPPLTSDAAVRRFRCVFLCTNPCWIVNMFICIIYVSMINPFRVGVIMNALHAMVCIGIWWLSYKSKFNKLFYTICTVLCPSCAVCGWMLGSCFILIFIS